MTKREKRKVQKASPLHDLIIRVPSISKDLDNLTHFFAALPSSLQNKMRYKVTDKKLLRNSKSMEPSTGA
jgi:hypothetical protein